jgi:hypothetical protein
VICTEINERVAAEIFLKYCFGHHCYRRDIAQLRVEVMARDEPSAAIMYRGNGNCDQ